MKSIAGTGLGLHRDPFGEGGGRTLTSHVLDQLRRSIVECELRPGARLRLEQLKATYGVGVSPLREALMRLASEGLVVLEEHRGFSVAPVSRSKFLDLTFIRKEIESLSLRLATEKGDDAWEAQVARAFDELAEISQPAAPRRADRIWDERHRAFHLALAAACGSEWLLQIRVSLFDQWDRYRRLAFQQESQPRDVLLEHREMMEAALERDAPALVYLMQRHISRSTKILEAAADAVFDSPG